MKQVLPVFIPLFLALPSSQAVFAQALTESQAVPAEGTPTPGALESTVNEIAIDGLKSASR